MPRTNLHTLARENESKLREQYQALVASGDDRVATFYQHCEERWSVSINLTQERLDFFLQNERPYNVYRFNHAKSHNVYREKGTYQEDESPIDWHIFQHVLGKWGPRRRVFNEFAHLEEEFTYAAYYLEGRGIFSENYGRYLMVMHKEWLRSSDRLTFLLKDSLQRYTLATADSYEPSELYEAMLCGEIASSTSITWLVCKKFQAQLLDGLIQDCVPLVCNPDDYLEAQISEDLKFHHVDKVKVRALSDIELELFGDLITSEDVVKVEELDTQEKKNAYYYMLFNLEFPKRGVMVEEF